MNLGLFENAIRSMIALHNPSGRCCKAMLLMLDLIILSNMENFRYDDRLSIAIYLTKDILLTRITYLEAIGDD